MFFDYQIYRLFVACVKSIKLFFASKRFLPMNLWLDFWLTHWRETIVNVSNIKLFIRSENLKSKLADLYMVTNCVIDRQYDYAPGVLSQCGVIIDIGAHIGSFSVYAARQTEDSSIFSFEPSPENYFQFNKNIALNRLTNVHPFQKAIAAHSGKAPFYYDLFNNAAHSLIKETKDFISVDCTTLKETFLDFKIEQCDFLKIDCEGAEYEILFNTPAEILKRIKRIALEYHNPIFYGVKNVEHTSENLARFLNKMGFETKILPENRAQGMLLAVRRQ